MRPTAAGPRRRRTLPPIIPLLVAAALPGPIAGQQGGGGAGTARAGGEVEGPRAVLESLTTRAEATGYVETSRYDDVVAFLRTLDRASDRVHLTTMGYTTEGRSIPLLVAGDVEDASPEAVRASGRLRVYLQGNIHGGEVPGKEALQMLMREVALGEHDDWLEEAVLLVAPLYNADGNERVALDNMPRQHVPLGGMGERANAMGLDLNRDHMKLDTPEGRSFAAMMTEYDPHLSVDLHTTNGTRHAYHLTYSPPLHPGTHPSLTDLLRGTLLPEITERIRERHGVELHYYGNTPRGDRELGWYTFDHRPRFNNNYIGLRNRLAILSEAYAYLTFEERVETTRWFVEEIVGWAVEHPERIEEAIRAADAASPIGDRLPTRATHARSDTMVTILLGAVEEERHPWTGETILHRLPVERPTRMWDFGSFRATEVETVPTEYLVLPGHADAVERLTAHGVRVEVLAEPQTREVEVFAVDSAVTAPRPFQGHTERTLFGAWTAATRTLPPGTVRIPVGQPLGRLVFYLLEPRSDDGLAAWGLLPAQGGDGASYPVVRVPPGG